MFDSIGKKLSFSYITIVIMTIIAGTVGIVSLSSLGDKSTSLVKVQLPQKEALVQTISTTKDIGLALQMCIFDKNEYIKHQHKQNITKGYSDLKMYFDILEKGVEKSGFKDKVQFRSLPLSGENLKKVKEAKKQFDNLEKLKSEMLTWHALKTTLYFEKNNKIMHVEEFFHQLLQNRIKWYAKLKEAANFDSTFDGIVTYKKTSFYKWYESFKDAQENRFDKNKNVTEGQKQKHLHLNKLLAQYNKDVKKLMKMAKKTNDAKGEKKKKNLKKVTRYYDRLKVKNEEIINFSYNLLIDTEKKEHDAFDKVEENIKILNSNLNILKINIQKSVKRQKQKFHKMLIHQE